MNRQELDLLRQQYCSTPYVFDEFVPQEEFTDKEIQLITHYGNWFEAIWRGEVPLVTEKLRHFYNAKAQAFADLTAVEEVWLRYDSNLSPNSRSRLTS